MSYQPIYTSELSVEGLTQITVTDTSKPNSTQLLNWIEEIEKGIDELSLGSYETGNYPNGMMVDVPYTKAMAENTIGWFEYITTYGYTPQTGRVVIPVIGPFVTITALYRNKNALDEAIDWEALIEGPASGSSWIPLKRKSKTKDLLIFGVFFYDNLPSPGYQRIQIVGTYGWNVNSKVLREYATLKVAEKLLFGKISTSDPGGFPQFSGGRFGRFAQTQFDRKLKVIKERTEEIEEKYFPREIPIAII